jgi:ribose-phosphate pyrophosphokinase
LGLTANQRNGFDYTVCAKVRHGDHAVDIVLPPLNVQGRAVVLLDDMASTGHTAARAAGLLLAAGAATLDLAVTHALFADGALGLLQAAGIGNIWSSDSVAHPSNAVSLAPLVAAALTEILSAQGAVSG